MILPDLVLEKFKSVLLVDDDEIVNSINKVMIHHAKFAERVIAKTGVDEALDVLRHSYEEGVPEVIFLDLEMPQKSGWDFLDELKKMKPKVTTKVVVLTSSISPKDEKKAKSLKEIVAYVPKPLSPELLHQIHVKHLA